MKLNTFQARIAVWTGLCLVISLVAIVIYSSISFLSESSGAAKNTALAEAHSQAGYTVSKIEKAMQAARILSQSLTSIKSEGLAFSREDVNGILKTVLLGNKEFLGVYTVWEPDAYDSMDAMQASSEGHDDTGRYIPYWMRSGSGEVVVQPAKFYTSTEPGTTGVRKGEYYLTPKESKLDSIINPTYMSNGDRDVFISSLVSPIIYDGQFFGICGVDLSLEFLQEDADNLEMFDGQAKMYLISNNGLVAGATGLKESIGKPLSGIKEDADFYLNAIRAGEEKTETRDGNLEVVMPMTVSGTNTAWGVIIEIPESQIYATAMGSTVTMIIISSILIVFAVAILWFISNRIASPVLKVISQLSDSAEKVSNISQYSAESSSELSEGASSQASNLEEISANLEEMAAMTKLNAENTNQANALVEEVRGQAKDGSVAMERMNSAIKKIKESSDRTAKILKTIDEIAFQTNLLALNAAVEAARAGEAGKGFAVVAEEVRNLAQRSAKAASETAVLIEEAQDNANNGVKVSTDVSKIFDTIVTRVEEVNSLTHEVSSASSEQAQGIDQLNISVSQMDTLTQSNAASAEESSAAGQELSHQANQLKRITTELVEIFNPGNSARAAEGASLALPEKPSFKPSRSSRSEKVRFLTEAEEDDF